MSSIGKKYTWKPDMPDFRDYHCSLHMSGLTVTALPTKVDLRDSPKVVYDRGNLGSCTANAIALGIDFERIKQKLVAESPSRLFIYYNERLLEGTVGYDSGAMLRDGIKSIYNTGACRETLWPYRTATFTVKPNINCYNDAKNYKIKQYLRLNNTNLTELKTCLAGGYGFVFGFAVYSSFETATVTKTGIIPIPKIGETLLGGHACYCLGYDDSKSSFIVRNSWGTGWGDKGHFYIPYQYLTNSNLADDFWSIQLV